MPRNSALGALHDLKIAARLRHALRSCYYGDSVN